MNGLTGRVAVVTGGSRGMRHAIAFAVARAGADRAVTYLSNAAVAHQVVGDVKRGLTARAHAR